MHTEPKEIIAFMRQWKLIRVVEHSGHHQHSSAPGAPGISGADLIVKRLQSILQIGEDYMQNAIKLTILLPAMLQSSMEAVQEVASTWLTPLEVAACFHLASCELNYYCCGLPTRPSVQEMSAVVLVFATLLLALMGWHVPRVTKLQPRLACTSLN